jgi:hypothetical protein
MRHSVTLAFIRASSRFNDGVALKHESRKVRALLRSSIFVASNNEQVRRHYCQCCIALLFVRVIIAFNVSYALQTDSGLYKCKEILVSTKKHIAPLQ